MVRKQLLIYVLVFLLVIVLTFAGEESSTDSDAGTTPPDTSPMPMDDFIAKSGIYLVEDVGETVSAQYVLDFAETQVEVGETKIIISYVYTGRRIDVNPRTINYYLDTSGNLLDSQKIFLDKDFPERAEYQDPVSSDKPVQKGGVQATDTAEPAENNLATWIIVVIACAVVALYFTIHNKKKVKKKK
ncbi:MAG: hypothetical protein ABIE94_04450 [archaeon]